MLPASFTAHTTRVAACLFSQNSNYLNDIHTVSLKEGYDLRITRSVKRPMGYHDDCRQPPLCRLITHHSDFLNRLPVRRGCFGAAVTVVPLDD